MKQKQWADALRALSNDGLAAALVEAILRSERERAAALASELANRNDQRVDRFVRVSSFAFGVLTAMAEETGRPVGPVPSSAGPAPSDEDTGRYTQETRPPKE